MKTVSEAVVRECAALGFDVTFHNRVRERLGLEPINDRDQLLALARRQKEEDEEWVRKNFSPGETFHG